MTAADTGRARGHKAQTLEALRQEGGIGSGLDADVTIYADAALIKKLHKISDELRFVLITSNASLTPLADLKNAEPVELGTAHEIVVQAVASKHAKCVRCWHHRQDVGSDANHPELCGRCIDNVDGDGEQRKRHDDDQLVPLHTLPVLGCTLQT